MLCQRFRTVRPLSGFGSGKPRKISSPILPNLQGAEDSMRRTGSGEPSPAAECNAYSSTINWIGAPRRWPGRSIAACGRQGASVAVDRQGSENAARRARTTRNDPGAPQVFTGVICRGPTAAAPRPPADFALGKCPAENDNGSVINPWKFQIRPFPPSC